MKNVSRTSLLPKNSLKHRHVWSASYVMLVLCFFLLIFAIIMTSPRIPSPYRFFSVQSGSMYPALNEGDLIITHREPNYVRGEILTFLPSGANENSRSMTHRVVELYRSEEELYKTQGDNNLIADENLVPYSAVFGKVIWSIPVLGLLIDWVKRPIGLVLTIFLPCLAIVLTEVRRIAQELKRS